MRGHGEAAGTAVAALGRGLRRRPGTPADAEGGVAPLRRVQGADGPRVRLAGQARKETDALHDPGRRRRGDLRRTRRTSPFLFFHFALSSFIEDKGHLVFRTS